MLLPHSQISLEGFRNLEKLQIHMKNGYYICNKSSGSLQGFRNLEKQQIHQKHGYYVSKSVMEQFRGFQEIREVADPLEKWVLRFQDSPVVVQRALRIQRKTRSKRKTRSTRYPCIFFLTHSQDVLKVSSNFKLLELKNNAQFIFQIPL